MDFLPINYVVNLTGALFAALGFWGVGRVGRRRAFNLAEDGLVALFDFAIGAWLTWTVFFFIGLAGVYRPITAWIVLGISSVIGITQLPSVFGEVKKHITESLTKITAYELILSIICILAVLSAGIGALTPPAAQDALVHHLALPKDYIRADEF
jgi:hypothetical protein